MKFLNCSISFADIEGFLMPFRKNDAKSNVSPNNKIVKAFFYGTSHPKLLEQNVVSSENKFVNSHFDFDLFKERKKSSNVSPKNKFVNSRLKLTKGS